MRLYHWFMIILLLCILHNQSEAEAAPEYLERIDDRKDEVVDACILKSHLTAWYLRDESPETIRHLFEQCLIDQGVTI